MSAETFEKLLAPSLRGVRALVHTRLGTTGYAEDVLQEILMRAFARRNQLRVEAKFRTWFWSIALNEIRQHFRRDRITISLDENPQFDVCDSTISPVARLEEVEMCEWLRDCMSELSERDRAAIRLRDIEEKSLPDTAAVLHSSLSATKTAHFRARKRLAHIIHARRDRCTPIRKAA
jgi:RNA polymerase sigma-70 factor (ECF subfamily)